MATRWTLRSAWSNRSRAFPATASPKATRSASRCWSTTAAGSSATTRPSSWPPCSTASRWASTPPASWCRTRSATAWWCARSMWSTATGTARWKTCLRPIRPATRWCGWGCGWSADCPRQRRNASAPPAPKRPLPAPKTSRCVRNSTARPCNNWPRPTRCKAWPATAASRSGTRPRCRPRRCCCGARRSTKPRCNWTKPPKAKPSSGTTHPPA